MKFNDDDFEDNAPKSDSTVIKKTVKTSTGLGGAPLESEVSIDIPFNIMIEGLPNDDYHDFKGISASGLKQAFKDPKLYAYKDDLMRLPSPALDMGNAVHESLLEPDKFDIKNYKLTPSNITKLEIMINNGKVMFDYILSKTQNERSLFFKDNGFIRKVRPDSYDVEKGIIYDVKTTRYNSKSKFIKDAYELGYHLQAAFYIDTLKEAGFKVEHFAFLVIPSESPCEPFAIQLTDRFISDGRASYTDVLTRTMEYDNAKGQVFFHVMDLPQWRINQLEKIKENYEQ